MASATRPAPAELQAAYQELILEHYRRPRNRGPMPGADATARVHNPLCGDEIAVAVALDGDRIREARFEGRGCSIAQASASMLTELVRGKTRAEVEDLRRRLRAMITSGQIDETLGPLVALSGVSRLPARVPCALMAWDAAVRAMKECKD
jgi:nitrogen fixation NifU-like protein